jgi:hypothetical protein
MSNLAFLEKWAAGRDLGLGQCKGFYAEFPEHSGNVEIFYMQSDLLFGVRLPDGQCIIRDIRCSAVIDTYSEHLEKLDNVTVMDYRLFDRVAALPHSHNIPF